MQRVQSCAKQSIQNSQSKPLYFVLVKCKMSNVLLLFSPCLLLEQFRLRYSGAVN